MYPTKAFVESFRVFNPGLVPLSAPPNLPSHPAAPTAISHNSPPTQTPSPPTAALCLAVAGVSLLFTLFDLLTRKQLLRLVEQVALEAARADTEREVARSRQVFTSMVTHEVRTPTSTIIGARGHPGPPAPRPSPSPLLPFLCHARRFPRSPCGPTGLSLVTSFACSP